MSHMAMAKKQATKECPLVLLHGQLYSRDVCLEAKL